MHLMQSVFLHCLERVHLAWRLHMLREGWTLQLILYQGVTWLCSTTRCQVRVQAQRHPQGTGAVADGSRTRLDLRKLEEDVQFYFAKDLTQSTQRTYRSGKDRYLKFCSQTDKNRLPVTEWVLCSFVSHLVQHSLKHRSIKVYLSAVRHLQIQESYPDPFGGAAMPKLEYVLRGVRKQKKVWVNGHASPSVQIYSKSQWEPTAHTWDTRMAWATCCQCFFAFLRVSEITVPDDTSYVQDVHLSFRDR